MITAAFCAAVGGAAVYVLATVVQGPLPEVPLDLPAYALVPAFALCEVLALRVARQHAHVYGFALAEVPLAIGLVYVDPVSLVVARMAAVLLVLAFVRRRPADAIFELALTAVQTVAAVAAFTVALGDASPMGWRGASALLAGLLASHLVAVGAIALFLADRWPGLPAVRQFVTFGSRVAAVDGAVGLGLALALWNAPHMALVLVAVILACLWSHRLTTRLVERRRRFEAMRVFAGSVERSSPLPELVRSVLLGARTALRADAAVLLFEPVLDGDEPGRIVLAGDEVRADGLTREAFDAEVDWLVPGSVARCLAPAQPGSPDWLAGLSSVAALAAPITWGDGHIAGALVVSQARRPRVFGFGDDQAELLGTLAEHASTVLENRVLSARLEREVALRAHEAVHDPVTGLPNRVRLAELLGEAFEAVYAVRGRVALLVIDLDEFSQVRDAFDHHSTDALVVQASRRIAGLLPEHAVLCRVGFNEFAAILPAVDDVDDAIAAARRLGAGFDPPFQVEGVLLPLSVNIGVAVYPEHAIDVPSLIQRAHIARDTARRHRSGSEVYDPLHDPSTPRRLALGAELREALEGSELDVCFQPKVEVATHLVRGAEALVRWNHPRLGRVRPSEFIAVAEHTGDIRSLTMVVMRRALAQCRSWRDRGLDMSVAVNLSARNLLDLSLVDDVASLTESMGVPPQALTLELTESMVMSESQRSVAVLEGLDELGVCLSCDDFGTGYSSLAHLRRLPIGEIKIDRSFIVRMTEDESDRAIARSVLALGRDLGLTTVAEGVESRDGWELLVSLGCDLAQGFLVCPPLTGPQFDQWLSQHDAAEMPPVSTSTVAEN